MTDFLRSMLAPEGMAAGRAAVVGAFEWFTHVGLLSEFDSYKGTGLETRYPGGVETLFAELYGYDILCLSIFPKPTPLAIAKGVSMFKMAVHRDDLPRRVGIDCSFGSTYRCAQQLHEADPNKPAADIFLAMVRNREVVISPDGIPATALRVCPKAAPDAPPSEWPMLLSTDISDVSMLEPDLGGNVWA
jgi:hypothetical protein